MRDDKKKDRSYLEVYNTSHPGRLLFYSTFRFVHLWLSRLPHIWTHTGSCNGQGWRLPGTEPYFCVNGAEKS